MVKIRLASPIQTDSVVDGTGLRMVIWTQGCPHHCEGCHNPESHDFNTGSLYDIETLCQEIKTNDYHDGITFSGGEPMEQAEACTVIANYAKTIGLSVWCYSGYTFEQLLKSDNVHILKFLQYIDVLVDGKFENSLKSLELKFKGSSNQRCIDVQKSLQSNTIETIF